MRSCRRIKILVYFDRFVRLAAAWAVIVAFAGTGCGGEGAPAPLTQGAYVWQRHWTDAVTDAVSAAAPSMAAFMVLAGELEGDAEGPRHVRMRVDWDALAASERAVWLVFRLATDAFDPEGAVDASLAIHMAEACNAAQQAGVDVAGVQVDYDCPTSRLDDYAAFLSALSGQLPDDVALSVTALPAWLGQDAFDRLARGLDHFVLQVHGITRPLAYDEPLVLCDAARIPGWLEQAARISAPYYVALPTYGYRAYYQPCGAFAFFGAETAGPTPPGWTHRDVYADPAAMAGVVRALFAASPRHCLGIIWFRLPTASDAFNWSWPTLARVMSGEAPTPRLAVAVRAPRDDLFEVWVHNQGRCRPGAVLIPVIRESGQLRALDGVNAFQIQCADAADRLEIRGPAPAPGEELLAAWWVATPDADGRAARFHAAQVETFP